MRFAFLIAAVAAYKLTQTETPQENGVIPNRVSGDKTLHKPWPSVAVAPPRPRSNSNRFI